ncbi:cation:proton antiporter [Leptolyngbya sp. AN02str]|uniref:cation:proton antiporter n=1 Tax=Leptolyngbya sp. AN02str TaxID=3423363 RepID=UPI003D310405
MDIYILDLLVIGILLFAVSLGSGWIERLPLSYALIYLIVGIALSPYGVNLIQDRPDTNFLERLTEFVVLVSLFSCGLKMNRPLRPWLWKSTIRLIGFLMPISIFGVAAIAHWLLQWEWGGAVLLGAILAPTDPVLASEVQLIDPNDSDELRFGLTSEGGLNDALAFPFVYFGLHWIDDSNWQNWFVEWAIVDLIWAIAAGLVVGIVVAYGLQRIENFFFVRRKVDHLMEDFVGLATILITYAIAELVNGYGFLAVFVVAMATQYQGLDSEKAAARLHFMERTEKLTEVGIILLLGTMLRVEPILRFAPAALLIALPLLFIIRPLGAWISTVRMSLRPSTRWLYGWFGIRGVGSLYYLAYALGHGLQDNLGEAIAWITFTTVTLSVTLHGISTTPLVNWYTRRHAKI